MAALAAAVLAGLTIWFITQPPAPSSGDAGAAALRSAASSPLESSTPAASPAVENVPIQSATPLITSTRPASPAAAPPTAVPTAVSLPSLGLRLEVRPVGIAADSQLALPSDPRVVGWYEFGPAPSSGTGAVVLAAHVDARGYGAGPLAKATQLKPGAKIAVDTTAGTVTYTVTEVVTVRKQELDTDLLFDRSGPERLYLVTCGGDYIKGQGWTSNVTVIAQHDG